MIKPVISAITLTLTLASCSLINRMSVPAAPFTVSGFTAPESVRYDASSDLYLVSNMGVGGLMGNNDNNGFISQVAPDGTILNKAFIAGGTAGVTLNAPKGMAIVGDTLYVADGNTLRLFNRVTGVFLRNIPIPGSSFLNDIAASSDGSVYVSDTGIDSTTFAPNGNDAIYKVSSNDAIRKIAAGAELKLPNGLAVLPDGKVQVVSVGSNEIFTVTDAGIIGDRRTLPGGQLDGVEVYNGGLLITSIQTSSLYFVNSAGAVSTLAGNLTNAADLGIDTRRGRAIIPLTSENAIRVVYAK